MMQVLDYHSNDVRILDHQGAPWWVLTDVCRATEHTNPTVAAQLLDPDERSKRIARHTKAYGGIMDEPVIKTRLYTTTEVFEEAGVPQYHVVRSDAYKALKKVPGNIFTQFVDVKTGAQGWEKWTEQGRLQLLGLLRSMSSKIIDFDQPDEG